MARHLLHRFRAYRAGLWLVLTLVFLLIHLVPDDPVEQMLGESAAPGQVEQLRHTWDSISRFVRNTATIN